MASTKRIYVTVIKKLKFEKIMKRILGIIAFIIGLKILTIDIKQCLVQIVCLCQRIRISVCSETPFSKNRHHTEISQPICFANQQTGFFTIRLLYLFIYLFIYLLQLYLKLVYKPSLPLIKTNIQNLLDACLM